MNKKAATPYRTKLSRPYILSVILFHLMPWTLYHFIRRPYRQHIPGAISAKKRFRDAIYDTVWHTLLDGYREITGLELLPSTGKMLSLFMELALCLDDQIEEHLGRDKSFSIDEELDRPEVRERGQAFLDYLQQFGRKEPILLHLQRLLAQHYTAYIAHLNVAKRALRFEDLLKAVELDSGVFLQGIMEIIALHNSHEVKEDGIRIFFMLGILTKFGDDMSDLKIDMEKAQPNLLSALIPPETVEWNVLQTGIQQNIRLDFRWWKRNCPETFARYFDYIEYYYEQIASSKLRLVCDFMLINAVLGKISQRGEK